MPWFDNTETSWYNNGHAQLQGKQLHQTICEKHTNIFSAFSVNTIAATITKWFLWGQKNFAKEAKFCWNQSSAFP